MSILKLPKNGMDNIFLLKNGSKANAIFIPLLSYFQRVKPCFTKLPAASALIMEAQLSLKIQYIHLPPPPRKIYPFF